jgi:LPXTG-site transpeptidase (sortase) family protein
MVTRRLAAAIAALLVVAAGVSVLVAVSRSRPPAPATVAATPVPIISVSPTAGPVGAPAAESSPIPSPTAPAPPGLRIRVPEVGIDLPIVEGDGYNAPLYKAAHYPGTAWPGEGGRSVLYAHARRGMFGPLFGARAGEHIVIDSPGGGVRTYVITQYYAHWPVTDLRWLRPGDHEEIVLVTCTTYNPNDPRIIAVGEPVA